MALAAIADNADFLAFDEIDICITIVIDAHNNEILEFSTLIASDGSKPCKPPVKSSPGY
jgi:hypothetical protein